MRCRQLRSQSCHSRGMDFARNGFREEWISRGMDDGAEGLKCLSDHQIFRDDSSLMAAPLKLLSDAWKESRKQDLLKSLPHIKPLHYLSPTDVAAMVEASTFRSFELGDIICMQVPILCDLSCPPTLTVCQGQVGSSFFCVEHGSVSSFCSCGGIAIRCINRRHLQFTAIRFQL